MTPPARAGILGVSLPHTRKSNLDLVRARVAESARRAGRPIEDVTLVAVTKSVEPFARLPAAFKASISACGTPAFLCQPLAMTLPPLTMTEPTAGLGLVLPTPFLART